MFDDRYISIQSLALAGFGFQAAWIFAAFWKPLQAGWVAGGTGGEASALSLVNGAVICAVYLLFCLTWRLTPRWLGRPGPIVAAAAIMMGGSPGIMHLVGDPVAQVALSAAAYAASAVLLLNWLRAFASYDSDTILKTIPGIVAACALICVGVAALIPTARLVLLMGLPPISAAFLLHERTRTVDAAGETSAPWPALLKLGVITLFVSVVVGALCGFGRYPGEGPDSSQFYLYFLFMIAATLLVLSATTFYRDYLVTPKSVREFPAFVIPAVILGLLAACLGLLLHVDAALFANAFGRCCLELTVLVTLCIAAQHYACSPPLVFSWGQAVFLGSGHVMFVLGSLPHARNIVTDWGLADATLGSLGVVVLLLACLALFVFTLLFVMVNRDFMLMVGGDAPDTGGHAADDETPEPALSPADQLAETYQLSAREREVLEEFSRGRSIRRIAEDLCVSVGTVNTYLRRIYQKMDIHSRQELLDRLDGLGH